MVVMVAVVGSFVCCSVVILFAYVVLLCVLFEGFKVVGVVVCGSVGNSRGWTCGAGTGLLGCCGGLVDNLLYCGLWIMWCGCG